MYEKDSRAVRMEEPTSPDQLQNRPAQQNRLALGANGPALAACLVARWYMGHKVRAAAGFALCRWQWEVAHCWISTSYDEGKRQRLSPLESDGMRSNQVGCGEMGSARERGRKEAGSLSVCKKLLGCTTREPQSTWLHNGTIDVRVSAHNDVDLLPMVSE